MSPHIFRKKCRIKISTRIDKDCSLFQFKFIYNMVKLILSKCSSTSQIIFGNTIYMSRKNS